MIAESRAKINAMDAQDNARGGVMVAAMVTLIELISNIYQLRIVFLCGRLSYNTFKKWEVGLEKTVRNGNLD